MRNRYPVNAWLDGLDSGQLTHCCKLPNSASRGLTSLLCLRIPLCHPPGCLVFTSSGSLHPAPTVFFRKVDVEYKIGAKQIHKEDRLKLFISL